MEFKRNIDFSKYEEKLEKKQKAKIVAEILVLPEKKNPKKIEIVPEKKDDRTKSANKGKDHEIKNFDITQEKKESNPELIAILKATEKGIVVHGETFTDEKGKELVREKLDLDSESALLILELAGIKTKDAPLIFVKKGESRPGCLHIDTGHKSGFVIEKDGSVFFDHHDKEKNSKNTYTSAVAEVYEKMLKLKKINKELWINKLVHFVNQIDNADYPESMIQNETFFKKRWPESLYGLYKALSFEAIIECIVKCTRENRSLENLFTDKEFNEDSLKAKNNKMVKISKLCENLQELVYDSIDGIETAEKEMKKNKIKTKTEELGSILLNIVKEGIDRKGKERQINKIPTGFPAVLALGFDTYIIWSEKDNNFFLTSKKFPSEKFYDILKEFPEARPIRGVMIKCPGEKDKKNEKGEIISKKEKLLKILEMIE
ncbi:MAG: hypothetical protein V1910_00155 [bacterium]